MIPDFQSFLLPVLQLASKDDIRAKDSRDAISSELKLTAEDREILLPCGKGTVVTSRLSWALAYLTRAGMLERRVRGVYSITPKGRELLGRGLKKITARILCNESPEFAAFWLNKKDDVTSDEKRNYDDESANLTEESPEETLKKAYQRIRSTLIEQLLQKVDALAPKEFEQLILALMQGIGYCGERGGIKHIGGPGDGGVDGVVYRDRLELERIYVQAKKYQPGNKIDPGTMNSFIGALAGKKAQKGVFVTTSDFTKAAREIAAGAPCQIALVNRDKLGELMFEHNVGTQAKQDETYVLKDIDEDFFEKLGIE